MSDTRMCNRNDLVELNQRAHKRHFNRRVPPQILADNLDPDGTNLLTLVLWGHNMEQAPILHHRVEVMAKITGSMTPAEFYLDVADEDWKMLPSIPKEVRDAVADGETPETPVTG